MDPAQRGRERWQQGDLRAAEAAFREALGERPDDPTLLASLAGVLADEDRFDAAIRILDRARDPAPHRAAPPEPDPFGRLRADIFRRSGRVEEAIDVLRAVVARDPSEHDAWQDLALDLAASGRTEEADAELARALERLPDDPHLLAARGMIFALAGRAPEAVLAYERAAQNAAGAPPPWRLLLKTRLAAALDMAGEPDRAIQTYRAILAEDADARQAHVELGIVLWRHERFDEAARVLRDARDRWPDEHDAAYYLADAERSLGRRAEAERIFRDSLTRWPECANCLYGLAEAIFEQDRPEEAALILRHVVAAHPDDPDVLGLFAEARFDIGERDAAREMFAQAIRLAPTEVRHVYNFALRERDAGRLEAATELFDRALTIAPDLDRALYFAAVCRVERGLGEQALDFLERFVAKAPPSRAQVRADPLLDPIKSLPRYRNLVGGSLLDFARPDASHARAALARLAAELPEAAGAGGSTLDDAVGRALAAAETARAVHGDWRPPPRFYFDTSRDGPRLVVGERDAANPGAPSRRLAVLERLRDGSYRVAGP